MQAVHGDIARWDRKDHRLADIVDALTMINRNLVQAHSKRRIQAPRPVPRPGARTPTAPGERKLGGQAIPLGELNKQLARWRNGGDPQ